jgi:hypothetical protein
MSFVLHDEVRLAQPQASAPARVGGGRPCSFSCDQFCFSPPLRGTRVNSAPWPTGAAAGTAREPEAAPAAINRWHPWPPRRCHFGLRSLPPTANVFCAVQPKAGRHFIFPTADRSGFEFAQVAVSLALAYPAAKTIHLVMDNRGNAWGSEESLTLRVSAGERKPGIGGSIVIASRSPGCSIAELLARSSATKRNPLRGQRPRGIRRMSAASGP